MKTLLTISLLAASTGAFALDALPNGHWAGEGHGSDGSGRQMQYTEELTVADNTTTSVLNFGGQKFTYVLKHTFKTGGFTDVTISQSAKAGDMHGTGYCGSVWCHVQSDDNTFEMTYVFEPNGSVYELGSDVEQGQKGWFESALKPVNK